MTTKAKIDQFGYDSTIPINCITRLMLPLAPKHYDYRHQRERLIPAAELHAQALASRVPAAVPQAGRKAAHVEALAFSNQMQRLAFEHGLISYNPELCPHWKPEAKLLERYVGAQPDQVAA